MARKKVQLRYIEDATARKVRFKKRRQGLLKKIEELSTLCDVTVCVVIYGEDDPTEPPALWPGDRTDVERALRKYQASPDLERWKRIVTQEGYVEERIEKFTEKLKKLGRRIHEMEMYQLMQLMYLEGKSHGEFTMSELKSLRLFARERVNELERRARFLREIGNGPPSATSTFANFRGFSQVFKQGSPSVATNGLLEKEEEVALSYSLQAGCSYRGNAGGLVPSARKPYTTATIWHGHMGSTLRHIGTAPSVQNPMLGGISVNGSYDTQAPPPNGNGPRHEPRSGWGHP